MNNLLFNKIFENNKIYIDQIINLIKEHSLERSESYLRDRFEESIVFDDINFIISKSELKITLNNIIDNDLISLIFISRGPNKTSLNNIKIFKNNINDYFLESNRSGDFFNIKTHPNNEKLSTNYISISTDKKLTSYISFGENRYVLKQDEISNNPFFNLDKTGNNNDFILNYINFLNYYILGFGENPINKIIHENYNIDIEEIDFLRLNFDYDSYDKTFNFEGFRFNNLQNILINKNSNKNSNICKIK